MARAESLTSVQWSKAAILWGIVMLAPPKEGEVMRWEISDKEVHSAVV
jgi:hypothetical protein